MKNSSTLTLPPGPGDRQRHINLIRLRRDTLGFMLSMQRKYGDVVHINAGGRILYLINDPETIKAILVTDHKNFNKGRGLETSKRLLGEGLLTSEGEFHRRQRRLVQPAFHRERIAAYGDVMVKHGLEHIGRWHDCGTVDISEEMMHLTLGIVAKTLFDTDVKEEADEIGAAVSEAVKLMNLAMLPFAPLVERFIPSYRRRFIRARGRLDETIYRMIRERRADPRDHGDLLSMLLSSEANDRSGEVNDYSRSEANDSSGEVNNYSSIEANNGSNQTNDYSSSEDSGWTDGDRENGEGGARIKVQGDARQSPSGLSERSDLSGEKEEETTSDFNGSGEHFEAQSDNCSQTDTMTDIQVRDEAMTIFLAGHETTANALMWTWYLLAQHPEVEQRMRDELRQVIGDRDPNVSDVPNLTYTRKVLSESMRLYPPAWTIGRRVLNDYKVGDYVLPAGGVCMISQYVTHHDERWFPEPFRFDPERWNPEAVAQRPRFSYYPFGSGPRVCIGENFAWMEGILLLATIARKWSMELVPGQKVRTQPIITLRSRHPIKMVLREIS